MTAEAVPYVHVARLRLNPAANPAAVGGAVTVELCGSWDHEGPCRWPHNNDIEQAGADATFRTVFVASAKEVDEVRARIERALRTSTEWTVVESGPRALTNEERELGGRLS